MSALELEGVRKIYRVGDQEIRALDGVDLRIEEGEFVAIIGPSGSGKSTLMHLLGCLDTPTEGRMTVCGTDLSRATPDELARMRNREIGFVFQLHHLLPQLTALENVLTAAWAVGSVAPHREAALRLLDRVGLGARLHHRPAQLSGGECQRVALARALLLQPDLLLADEPTGSVDAAVAGQLADLLCELQAEQGTTLVIATHAPEIAARLSRTLRLRDGRLAAP